MVELNITVTAHTTFWFDLLKVFIKLKSIKACKLIDDKPLVIIKIPNQKNQVIMLKDVIKW